MAARPSGEVVTLEVNAPSPAHAMRLASEQGVDPISARRRGGIAPAWGARKERFPLILFTQELISLLQAGLTLLSALQALLEKEKKSFTGGVLSQIVDHLTQGRSFSFAIEQLPNAFPAIYVSTVRASERTGDL